MLLEGKNAVIYGAGGTIGGTVARLARSQEPIDGGLSIPKPEDTP